MQFISEAMNFVDLITKMFLNTCRNTLVRDTMMYKMMLISQNNRLALLARRDAERQGSRLIVHFVHI